jgi:F-type H+-transporting ATPase subunit b
MGLLVNGTALASIVSFLVLVFLLSRLAWKPLRQIMADRQSRILSALKEAADAREEAQALRRQLDDERREARLEAQRLLERAEKAAREEAQEIVAAAKTAAQQLQAAATAEIAAEREAALTSIRTEVADLALRIAERVVRAELDGERQRALLEQALNDVVRVQ